MDQETKQEFETLTHIIKDSFDGIEHRLDNVEHRLDGMDGRMDNMERRMATKEDLGKQKLEILDAIDDKLADLKGDLVILMRKEDKKLLGLIDLLRKKAVITDEEVKSLVKMEPFPQLL